MRTKLLNVYAHVRPIPQVHGAVRARYEINYPLQVKLSGRKRMIETAHYQHALSDLRHKKHVKHAESVRYIVRVHQPHQRLDAIAPTKGIDGNHARIRAGKI